MREIRVRKRSLGKSPLRCARYLTMSVHRRRPEVAAVNRRECPIATFVRIAIPGDPLYKSRLGWIAGMVQERPDRVERRLSAILAADVAGYSRLMHNDEEATHAKLATLLANGVKPAIADYGGRCVSAWNKDPVFGVIGIQSGPPGQGSTVASIESWKPRLGCWWWRRLRRSVAPILFTVSRSRRSAESLAYRARWSARSSVPRRRSSGTSARRSRFRRWAPGAPSLTGCWRRTRARRRGNG